MKNIKVMVFLAMFITMEVILTRFLSIQTPLVRIGFTFLPIALSAMMFGPVLAGLAAAAADLLGMILFPAGAYFPGFTLTAFLTGATYGVFLHNKSQTLLRVGLSAVVVSMVINLGLDSVWLWMITGKGFLAILPARIIKCMIMLPIQVIVIQVVSNYLNPIMNKVVFESTKS